ncbi:MAG: peptidase M28 [Deltaproteobacteria bacterium]|nr:peptidase M28 [Deltaproteobacteria bacterium]
MKVGRLLCLLGILAPLGCNTFAGRGGEVKTPDPATEGGLYHDARQLTFAGRRSGEGYFSPDGREIVFQSEREPGNPFYQIYRMSLETGETTRVSPGLGKTTCAFVHPDGERVLFASTHLDREAEGKQEAELEERASGRTRRYAWGFDPQYDLFARTAEGRLDRLTGEVGYDAEASYSPDGRWIAFSSNRHAYTEGAGGLLDADDRDRLAEDPSFFIDLYLLDTEDGSTRRLTNSRGYDGGSFFSPDGQRVIWRRFSEDGARAEIHSMRLDGSDERILTRMGVMSWAPFYHPSGDYVVFTTNRHGHDNSELYLVDAEGQSEPVRVTERDGFDGLPVFSPDGKTLLFTSNRTAGGQSQLFRAAWNDAAARQRLGLGAPSAQARSGEQSLPPSTGTLPEIREADLAAHVRALTDDRTSGRRAGTPGELVSAEYLAREMQRIGLAPAGEDGSYRHRFDFTAGIALGLNNTLELSRAGGRESAFEVDSAWRPLAFSKSGDIPDSPVVFAGYGLVAPAAQETAQIDDYAGVDVRDRWVMVFRGLPQSAEAEQRQHLQRYASMRHKAMIARDRGARGLLVVSGPLGRFRHDLVPLRFDASLAGTRIAVISLGDETAEALIARSSVRSLSALQAAADARILARDEEADLYGTELDGISLRATIDLETQRSEGQNVVGRLQVGAAASRQTIVIGAHYDHLGHGEGSSSLASGALVGAIHPGADDNASGVAVMLELAEQLMSRRLTGADLGRRDFVFAAWSGEELGLLGSDRWAADHVDPHSNRDGPVAYLNFDMVGRLRSDLVVQGLGSSPDWGALLERAAVPLELSVSAQNDAYLPTDATSFYTQGVPVLSAFTGVHSEYHTPRDTIDLLNLEGAVQIGELFGRIAVALSRAEPPPSHRAQAAPSSSQSRSGFRVFLGTVPDYAQSEITGVQLTGVAPDGPAEKAGMRGGDIIVEVDGRTIENLYDYTYSLDALRVGEAAAFVVRRDEELIQLEVVPASRD